MNYPAFVLSVACATFPVLVVLLVYIVHRVNELEGLLDALLHPVTTWRHKPRRHRRLARGNALRVILAIGLLIPVTTAVTAVPAYAQNVADEETPVGIVDGFNQWFKLAHLPITSSVKVYRNGIRQKRGIDYVVYNNKRLIGFLPGSIPQTGDIILVDYKYLV